MSTKFMIIDGSSLVHRAFYALPILSTAGGIYTNAVYGFTTMLLKLLENVKPDAVAVAFDKSRITFRNEFYQAYKAHRQATPSELAEQFSYVRRLVEAFGIKVLEEAGYEADDIIGTVACQAEQHGFDVLIVTGDKDALQLVKPGVQVMLTRKGITDLEVFNPETFFAKYGITPKQFIDMKGLMGDPSDNIPGVAGIGEKTALKLLQQFGDMEAVLQHLDQVSGKKLQETLANSVEIALLSKKLATIVCDMPLAFEAESYKFQPDMAKLQELFILLEFQSLIPRLTGLTAGKTIPALEEHSLPTAQIAVSAEDLAEIRKSLRTDSCLAVFPVVSGAVPALTVDGMAVSCQGQAVYVPADSACWDGILSLLADSSVAKMTHDGKQLLNSCRQMGAPCRHLAFDTIIAAYLIEPSATDYSLNVLSHQYLSQMANVTAGDSQSSDFAVWAARTIEALYPVFRQRLESAGLFSLFADIEVPLVDILSAMETGGITVDTEHLKTINRDLSAKIEKLLAAIYAISGEQFNVNSTKQLGALLFDKLQLPVIKKTKTGYSTDAEVLDKLLGRHPVIEYLLNYRMLTKLKSTYLDGMGILVNSLTGRIHTTFNQTVTTTGRLSSSEPNLQNIPVRTEEGRRIRELFIPGRDWNLILSADYSQIELRVLAHMSDDANLIDAFRQNQDIHTRTASEVFGVSMAEVTPPMRSKAKAVNFGIVYGISDYGLSRDIGVARKEAALYIESYFSRYPGVKKYMEQSVAMAKEQGYVSTLFGRRRYLPDINNSNFSLRSFAERTAMNTPIQGTAADIIKKAMVDVYALMQERRLKSRMLVQVHDELLFEVTEEEKDEVASLVKQAMEQTVELSVPLLVDVNTGENWAAAK
ncbi:DNA polymerase I [Acetonema longum]|uniref:DNA polymerase I n=1 Tax=Acetonema longum DSM 6540 TaxID=1009370 RepID=F7NDW7_9FIRM|nr:DNA polymerase I [Acetonema longum]EGO65782.1 DNA polymerase I [Acetonema longum DSM 6540]